MEQCTQWRSLIDPQTKIFVAHSKNYNSPLRIIKYSCMKITFARLRKSILSKAKNIVSIYKELVTQQRKLICSILKNSPPQNEKSIPSNTKKCTPAYDKYNPAYEKRLALTTKNLFPYYEKLFYRIWNISLPSVEINARSCCLPLINQYWD
ncbi:hypothetical protein BDC45DRAFT_537100 [Circinella umbellata]|nr:hypothetical protein BDC45DRAFT_537100 [Circinella umbellata]